MVLGRSFRVEEAWVEAFRKALPFPLTRAQERVMGEIAKDMQSPRQMARLLQGDVGSGKTVVAAFALYLAAQNGAQGALMAPTEILAKQHFQNLARYLFPLGVRVELLLGSMSQREKEAATLRLKSGEAQVAVGTHASSRRGWGSKTWASRGGRGAPLRGAAAPGPPQARPSSPGRPGDVRHPHPPLPGPNPLRGPGGEPPGRDAPGPHPGEDQGPPPPPPPPGLCLRPGGGEKGPPGLRGGPGH